MDSGIDWRFRSSDLWISRIHHRIRIGRAEFGGYGDDFVSDDIADALPSDPFGMDAQPISGRSEILEFQGANQLLPKWLKFIWEPDGVSFQDHRFNGDFDANHNRELSGEGSGPHDAFSLTLDYMGVEELIVVERVCRSLRDEVRESFHLWRTLRIDPPLSHRIHDQALIELASRAQGRMEVLRIINGYKITDNGLKEVVQSNRMLTELYVPNCVSLTIEGIISCLRVLKSAGTLKMKRLRVGGLAVTKEQFDELKFLLGVESHMDLRGKDLHFFHVKHSVYDHSDDRIIDVETCPKCDRVGEIYDCARKSCQQKDQVNESCRACYVCIKRCSCCGCCIKDRNCYENFSMDLICLDCGNKGSQPLIYRFASTNEMPVSPLC